MRGGVYPALFQNLKKSALNLGKSCPDCGYLWVNLSFEMQFCKSFQEKKPDFFACGAFLSRFVHDCLSKFPNSKKSFFFRNCLMLIVLVQRFKIQVVCR